MQVHNKLGSHPPPSQMAPILIFHTEKIAATQMRNVIPMLELLIWGYWQYTTAIKHIFMTAGMNYYDKNICFIIISQWQKS